MLFRRLFAPMFVLALAKEARADDAREVANRVVDQWSRSGGHAVALPTRFLFDAESMRVPIPIDKSRTCTHVALIGPRGLGFRARFEGSSNDPFEIEPGKRATSVAGIVELQSCAAGDPVGHVIVTSGSSRGALEIVVAHAPSALPPLVSILPERTGGWLPPAPDVGGLSVAASPEKRADFAESRGKRDGARVAARTPLRADDDGGGEREIVLGAGCHRLELFARDPMVTRAGRRVVLDLDAELRDLSYRDRVLARDRTEAPDARLETCVGEASRVAVVFAGAPRHSEVVSTHVSWPMPDHLPSLWGPLARGRMARVLFSRHAAPPLDAPIFLGQGGSGTSPFPVAVEIGGCYLAVAAVIHGQARSLQLRAVVGARESTDERGAAEEAALTAFCVEAHERVRLDVHARGAALGWGLALFRIKSGVWEAGR